jgi:DNA polymerase III delta prime subunit
MLLTGPAGSGKTAAVYACARELGYEVLEISASQRRTGRDVLDLLEATQSRCLRWEAGGPAPQSASAIDLTSPEPRQTRPEALAVAAETRGDSNHPPLPKPAGAAAVSGRAEDADAAAQREMELLVQLQLIEDESEGSAPASPSASPSESDDSRTRGSRAKRSRARGRSAAPPRKRVRPAAFAAAAAAAAAAPAAAAPPPPPPSTPPRTRPWPAEAAAPASAAEPAFREALVLVDDADVVFDEDNNFYGGLRALIRQSRRPVVLTAQRRVAECERVCALRREFARPSLGELAAYLLCVAAVETGGWPDDAAARVAAAQVLELARFCGCDTRRALLALQLLTRARPLWRVVGVAPAAASARHWKGVAVLGPPATPSGASSSSSSSFSSSSSSHAAAAAQSSPSEIAARDSPLAPLLPLLGLPWNAEVALRAALFPDAPRAAVARRPQTWSPRALESATRALSALPRLAGVAFENYLCPFARLAMPNATRESGASADAAFSVRVLEAMAAAADVASMLDAVTLRGEEEDEEDEAEGEDERDDSAGEGAAATERGERDVGNAATDGGNAVADGVEAATWSAQRSEARLWRGLVFARRDAASAVFVLALGRAWSALWVDARACELASPPPSPSPPPLALVAPLMPHLTATRVAKSLVWSRVNARRPSSLSTAFCCDVLPHLRSVCRIAARRGDAPASEGRASRRAPRIGGGYELVPPEERALLAAVFADFDPAGTEPPSSAAAAAAASSEVAAGNDASEAQTSS